MKRFIARLPRTLTALFLTLCALAIALALSLRAIEPRTPGTQIGLDSLAKEIARKTIVRATIYEVDGRAVYRLRDGRLTWVAFPQTGSMLTSMIADARDAGAAIRVEQQWGKRITEILAEFILPLLVLANLFGIFILLARGGASQIKELFAFSRIGAKPASRSTNPYRFGDVAGAGSAIEELAEVRDYLADPTRFAALGASPPKGVLLYGPPGCGKTLLARALAGEANVPFYFISGSEFVESLVGVGAARVRDLFRLAMQTAPSIVFVDELDAAGRKRGAGLGGGHDEREQTLNEMLVQMDGFSRSLGVVVIAATNRPDILDPALLRPGRFDRHIAIEPPDATGRQEILGLHARSRPLEASVSLESIARICPGFSGADLASVVNEAALLAVRRGAAAIGTADLEEAVQRVQYGPKRQGRIVSPDELRRVAYHEAGHVLVSSSVDFPAEIHRVSILARGRGAAQCDMLRTDRTLLTRSELLAELVVTLGGLAAEQLECGEVSTASEADIEHATDLARRFAGRYGMTPALGRVRLLQKDTEVFLGRDYLSAQSVAAATLERMDQAVRELIDDAERRALEALQRRRGTLDAIASALLENEVLDASNVAAILQPPRRRRAVRT